MTPRSRLFLALAIVLGIYVVGTIGYVVIVDCTLFEAAYMTTITLSTVGFAEVLELDPVGKLWTVLVITLGVGGVSFAFTSVVSLAVSGDIQDMVGRRKLTSRIAQLKGHVVLCGYGRMGSLAVDGLRKLNVDVVVVENGPLGCQKLREAEILHIEGDATEEEILVKAGLHHCKALVAALPHDADNVYITLTARGLRPGLQIIARAELPSTESKLRRAGATQVICPQIVGANKIANIITRPNVVEFFEVADRGIDLELDEFVVEAHSPLCDMTLRDAPIRNAARATVIAIKRHDGETIYQPSPDVRIRQHDTLVMIGETGVSTRLNALT